MPDPLESLGRRIAKLPSDPPKSIRERVNERVNSSGLTGTLVAATALTTAIGGAIAAIVAAVASLLTVLRQPLPPDIRIDLDILKADRLQHIAAQPGKEAERAARALTRQKELDAIRNRLRDLEARCPAEVVMPNRSPR